MASNYKTDLFTLTIDPVTKKNLGEVARWAKIFSIAGMVMIVLLLLFGVVASVLLSSTFDAVLTQSDSLPDEVKGYSAGLTAIYLIIISVIWFFPFLFLLRFSAKINIALASSNQQLLNDSFYNLKVCFRYLGIITIIVMVLYALLIGYGIFNAYVLKQ